MRTVPDVRRVRQSVEVARRGLNMCTCHLVTRSIYKSVHSDPMMKTDQGFSSNTRVSALILFSYFLYLRQKPPILCN